MNRGRGRANYHNQNIWGARGASLSDRVTRYGAKPSDFNEPAFVTQPSPIPVIDSLKRSPPKTEPESPTPATPVSGPPEESLPPVAKSEGSTENNGVVAMETESDDKGKKPWATRRSNDARLPKKIRKRRQNARLKSILVPKNAMMLLHELHPDMKMTILEQASSVNQAYTVEIEIEGEIYRGHGMSKAAAKQAGSENALKAVLLKKIEESKAKSEDVEMTEASAENGARRPPPEDDVPWGSLASFAMFKLFSEWQAQGFQLPCMGQTSTLPVKQSNASSVQAPQKKIPEDAHTKHPVQLLNQLRPGLQYLEDREGMPPNTVFTFRVTFDDQSFSGSGHNKKDAKKNCAKRALQAMGVVYPPE